jgi:hypothetical protein
MTIMEIDRFNKFVIDTHSWRSNKFKNQYRWSRSLWDVFGWSGPDRFALWEDLSQEYAVINNNLNVEEYSLMCCEGITEANIYEIPKLNGYWKQSHLCFGLDQLGTLEWHHFKIYCSDDVPGNGEFVLWKSIMVVPMLLLDGKRCLFAEEEEMTRYNSRRSSVQGNVYMMERTLMEIYRRLLIKCYKIRCLIFRFPRKVERTGTERWVEFCPLHSIFRKQQARITIENDLVDDQFMMIEGRYFNFEELLEEWVINKRGITSMDEYYDAGGFEEDVHLYFDPLGAPRRRSFGGIPAVGDGHSDIHLRTKNPEQ